MDAIEADGTVYIMTERVKPLSAELPSWEAKPVNERQDWLSWGLHRITVRAAVHNCSPRNRHTLSPLNTTFLMLIFPRMLFRLSTPRVMQPMVLFASVRYSFLSVVNGNLEGSSSLVIPLSRMLSLWCVSHSIIHVSAASYKGS